MKKIIQFKLPDITVSKSEVSDAVILQVNQTTIIKIERGSIEDFVDAVRDEARMSEPI